MRKRLALCVGNNYPGTNAELLGCVNDAWDWTELLGAQGYEVHTMLEANAPSVVGILSDMVARIGFGDRIVFTFSGHGTWVPDRNGDEADGRDEALVMAGLSASDLILDDQLQGIFTHLGYGARALILSDSCHSGTVSRFTSTEQSAAFGLPKFISPVDLADSDDLSFERVLELEARAASEPRRTASLISGCDDLEYSYDASFDGRANGAFSRVAIDAFKAGMTLGAWHNAIRTRLPSTMYPQTPKLVATPYRRYTKAL